MRATPTKEEKQNSCNDQSHYPPRADNVTHTYGSVWECPTCGKRTVLSPSKTYENPDTTVTK